MLSALLIFNIVLFAVDGVYADNCAGVQNGKFAKNPDGDCQDYLFCYNGEGNHRRCPNGFVFNGDEQICDNWEHGFCTYANDPCNGKAHLVTVNRPTGTCASYYQCEYGRGVPLNCPDGFYFDEANQMCNFPDRVNCKLDYRVGPDNSRLPTPAATAAPSTAPTPSSTTTETPATTKRPETE